MKMVIYVQFDYALYSINEGYTLVRKLVSFGAHHRPRWSMILGLVIGTLRDHSYIKIVKNTNLIEYVKHSKSKENF